jgi:saccharopine dehydrogenase (NAD+, L-lysine-forming)
MLKIALIKEGKVPEDTRVVLTPKQVNKLKQKFRNVEFAIQKCSLRCYQDKEYKAEGISIVKEVDDFDILLGVKEVPVNQLLPNKTYLFFSHTIKKQPYNREILQTALKNNIRLIDYEVLTDENGIRLIGFGRFAGIVGAHYSILMWGKKQNLFDLKKAIECKDYQEMISQYKDIDMGNPKFLVTGNGRVSKGAVEVLEEAGVERVSTNDYLNKEFSHPVYLQLDMDELYGKKDDDHFNFQDFFDNPKAYDCQFKNFWSKTDVLVNGMYWSPRAARLFELADIKKEEFNVKIISDISCDINGSVPLTLKATKSDDPVYGYNPSTNDLVKPYSEGSIDIMTVDNLPNELPRDASEAFGEVMSEKIIPLLIDDPGNEVLNRASITQYGDLTKPFEYLRDYALGKE